MYSSSDTASLVAIKITFLDGC